MNFENDQHGLQDKDVDHQDKQNFDAILRIIKAASLLDSIPDAVGTKCYDEIMRCALESFLNKDLVGFK